MSSKRTRDVLHTVKGKKHTVYFGFDHGFEDGGGMLIQPPVSLPELDFDLDTGVRFKQEVSSTFGTLFHFEQVDELSLVETLDRARQAAEMLLREADKTADIEAFKDYYGIEGEED